MGGWRALPWVVATNTSQRDSVLFPRSCQRHRSFPWIGSVVRCQFYSLRKKQPQTLLLGPVGDFEADGKLYILCLPSFFISVRLLLSFLGYFRLIFFTTVLVTFNAH